MLSVLMLSVFLTFILLALCHLFFSKKLNFSLLYNKLINMLKLETTTKPQRIVVFDLDETLGSFLEIGIFWDALEHYYGHNLFKERLFEILDLFEEFLRPNILNILAFVKEQKIKNACDHVMIYTNNQGPKSWVKMLSEYFNTKLDYELFDKIIAAFKVRDKVIEMCRTSHAKSVKDLIRCTKIPPHTEICFIDDQFHPLMEEDNVYYINVKPYAFSLPYAEMAERYYDACLQDKDKKNVKNDKDVKKTEFINRIVANMQHYHFLIHPKSQVEQEADKVVSKQLLIHLENFFKKGRTKNTRKRKTVLKSKSTRRKNMFI
jgi:hypothetical protein